MDMGICIHFWCNITMSKYVDGKFRWLHEMAPQGEGKSIIDSTEDGDETVFECLDSPFGKQSEGTNS
jgi:hypothetical protein